MKNLSKNICIIGGSGFIGTRLCSRFKNLSEFNFYILDKKISIKFPRRVRVADVRSIKALRTYLLNDSIIINLAAEHRDDVTPKSLYDSVNVGGARNICQVAREKNIKKIIFTSSVAVYGFAPPRTDEFGMLAPFNDYGRTKLEAEQVYKDWQLEDSENRILVIVRPTVVFGEENRGNVFNLLKQIALGKFIMIGDGLNCKSMAYVENLAAFLEYSLGFQPGVHIYNYIDKPDFTMNDLIAHVNRLLGRSADIKFRVPFILGLLIGYGFDIFSILFGKKFPISAIRVRKFCANSVYDSAIKSLSFVPPVSLFQGIESTIRYEFIENHQFEQGFYSE